MVAVDARGRGAHLRDLRLGPMRSPGLAMFTLPKFPPFVDQNERGDEPRSRSQARLSLLYGGDRWNI